MDHDVAMATVLRPIRASDLPRIAGYDFTISISRSLTDPRALQDQLIENGLWDREAGALAIEFDGRLIGARQFYRAAPCIHGYELGYIIHDAMDRGLGHATSALGQLTDLVFDQRPACYRLQLVIEVWNTASWKVAERCGYVREGLLRSAGFGTGDPSDCFIYSRTREDWHEQRHAGPSLGGDQPGLRRPPDDPPSRHLARS